MTHDEGVREELREIVRENRVANAYLFTGGTAEKRAAFLEDFAHLLADSEADILRPEQEKPNLFSVDDVRRGITETVSIRPYGNGRKVYLLPNAALMNVQAENALLKTLEEPPEYVVLLLAAPEESVFLPTVLSRAVKWHLSDEGEKENAGEEAEKALERVRELLRGVEDIRADEILKTVTLFSKDRQIAAAVADGLLSWFRDVLAVKSGGEDRTLQNPDERGYIARAAERLSYEKIREILDEIEKATVRIGENVNVELLFQHLLFSIAGALAHRENLEQGFLKNR